MRTIWKFEVPLADEVDVMIPPSPKVLRFGAQGGRLYLWALVDPDRAPTAHTFRLVGTGHPLPDEADHWLHIGTCQQGPFVWHLFIRQGAMRMMNDG